MNASDYELEQYLNELNDILETSPVDYPNYLDPSWDYPSTSDHPASSYVHSLSLYNSITQPITSVSPSWLNPQPPCGLKFPAFLALLHHRFAHFDGSAHSFPRTPIRNK